MCHNNSQPFSDNNYDSGQWTLNSTKQRKQLSNMLPNNSLLYRMQQYVTDRPANELNANFDGKCSKRTSHKRINYEQIHPNWYWKDGFVCVCPQWALTKIYFFASRPMKSNKHFLHLLVNQKDTAEQRKQLIEKPSLAI